MAITYRAANLADLNFCRSIHHSGMRPYVEPLWGWKQDFQDERFSKKFNPKLVKIVRFQNKDVGYLETFLQGDSLKIENLILDPAFRGKGIGRKILEETINSAPASVRKFLLNVLSNNPSQNLYKRLGFQKVAEDDDLLTLELVRSLQ
jgi:ribosomal protein S18 acetylase RimI-like enzyme